MAVNWVLPVRGAQAVLSIVVLGLMAYGTFGSCSLTTQAESIPLHSIFMSSTETD